ncbi:MAG: TetR family transcriptional regulator [Oscillospiraceae bacterium]|nr:TetR family transcriptional regulator [Oscillospiraceae bacterium]
MSKITKRALSGAFERLLTKKPLEKVTVKDIVEEAEVNRQTFYYHFKDIYDLIEWIFVDEAERVLADINRRTWQESLKETFECIMEHRLLILKVFHSPNRDDLDQFIFKVSHPLFVSLVANSHSNQDTSPEDCALIARFYTFALMGMLLDWVRNDMQDDPLELVLQVARLITGDLKFKLDLGE